MSNSDIIAYSSVVIALCALFATVWQAQLAYKHNRLSIKPVLVWHIARKDVGENSCGICFSLRNLGMGPAIIRDRYFSKDGVRFEVLSIKTNEVRDFVDHVYGSQIQYKLKNFGLPGKNSAMANGQEIIVADVEFPSLPLDQIQTAINLAGSVEFHVKYESIYEEKFELEAT